MGAAASMNPIIPSADVYKMITVDVDRGGFLCKTLRFIHIGVKGTRF